MARLRPLWLHVDEISRRLANARFLNVATDYDGTLVRLVAHPELAALDPRVRRSLASLARDAGVRVAILSGRRLEDVRGKLRVAGVFVAGSNGFETLDEAGRRETHLPAARAIPKLLRESLADWVARFSGAWLEDKRFTLALHYRGVDPGLHSAFRSGIRRRVEVAGGARLLHGKRVHEILPDMNWDKSSALRLWRARRPGGLLFYFGDDTNDESVHQTVVRLGGIAVAVGRKASRAEYALSSPEDVMWFLEWLEREWSAIRSRRLAARRAWGRP